MIVPQNLRELEGKGYVYCQENCFFQISSHSRAYMNA